jgi:hypothetical protein
LGPHLKVQELPIFFDDIIMYTLEHQLKKDVERHADCPKEAFF